MARFDVYPNPSGNGYLLDVQADLHDGMSNRIVVPLLLPKQAPKAARRLNPLFPIDGKDYVMVTQYLGSVPATILRNPATNLSQHTDDIRDALDFLLIGF